MDHDQTDSCSVHSTENSESEFFNPGRFVEVSFVTLRKNPESEFLLPSACRSWNSDSELFGAS